MSSDRPNILVVMSDEHNASVTGCYGNPIVQTPHLDALAARGIAFHAAYCNSPLCVPSRASFTAGKYVSRVGAWNNESDLPRADYPSLPRLLNAAGYQSYLCGKQHYDCTRRYGFTDLGVAGHNISIKTGRGERRDADDLAPAPGYSERFDHFGPGDHSEVLHHDRDVTATAAAFLRERSPDDPPFFLFAGYLAPHFPLVVPEGYWRRYEGRIPMPPLPEGHLASLPRNYQHLRVGFHLTDVPDEVVRRGRELYYGLTEWVDNEIGVVLDALGGSASAENTVVIYTSDHGEHMGEHGLWWKNAMFEQAARVPLIVSWPARWAGGQRRTRVCSLVDVVQTIAALGDADVPPDWDGDSLLPWLDDPHAAWKDFAVSEYYSHNIASGYVMYRSGTHKYVYHTAPDDRHPPERELYDLAADPGEFANLASDPAQAGRVAAMHAALVAELGEEPDVTEARCRADFARGYDRADFPEEPALSVR